MMKNNVLLRCKRTRWHSVIGDSSIHNENPTWKIKNRDTLSLFHRVLQRYPPGSQVTSVMTVKDAGIMVGFNKGIVSWSEGER